MAKKVVVPEPVVEEIAEPEVEEEEVQEETPAEEPTEEEPVEEVPIVEPPRKKTAQERIDEITRARREAEREAEYWRNQVLKREPMPEPEKPVATPGKISRPSLDQFETTVEYEDALFEWRDKVREQETAVKQAQSEEEKALRSFNEKAKKARDEYEDFDEVIESPVFSPIMRAVLLRSDNGPDVAYFLGKPENRDLADRIRIMPLESQAYEIGKLESSLLLAKKTRKVPGAPKPLEPVGMGGAGGKEKDPSEMEIGEWMAWNKQRELDKLKRKYEGGP